MQTETLTNVLSKNKTDRQAFSLPKVMSVTSLKHLGWRVIHMTLNSHEHRKIKRVPLDLQQGSWWTSLCIRDDSCCFSHFYSEGDKANC